MVRSMVRSLSGSRTWALTIWLTVSWVMVTGSTAVTAQVPRNTNPPTQKQSGQAQRGQATPQRSAPVRRVADPSKVLPPKGVNFAFKAPDWMPLTQKHGKYLDEILGFWEYHCKEIQYYECDFLHFVYGPTREQGGGRLANGNYPPLEKHEGIIKYSEPDKAMFKTTKVYGFDAKLAEKYVPKDVERFGNHWICDGKAVYDFDYPQKTLFVDVLPPEAQGKAIDRGPLPFLFRAKKADLHHRFWMRVITPPKVKDEYWIEIVPKYQGDSAYFQKAHIIIAEKDYLPQAIVLFDPAYSPGNPKKQSYIFNNRKINWNWKDAAKGLLTWQKQFYEPQLPRGWKKVQRSSGAPPQSTPQPASRSQASSRQSPLPGQAPRKATQSPGAVGGIR
jgi:TIGR03009 family protein